MKKFSLKVKEQQTLIAMIHVQALPGTPANKYNVAEIIAMATAEAELYAKLGVDALLIENMHDTPYTNNNAGPEITAAMTMVAQSIKSRVNLPLGIQILAAANKEALAVAHAAQLEFIRAEGFVFGHMADEGLINSCAGELLRYRKLIGAEDVAIFTDIKKKHSAHALTSDISLAETASAAAFFKSDGVIITGSSTGKETNPDHLKEVKEATELPVIVGSGVNIENIKMLYPLADAFIVGSAFKIDGIWHKEIDPKYVDTFVNHFNKL